MDNGEVSRIVAGETVMTTVLMIVVIVILVGLIGWLTYDIFLRKREIVNLVDDVNSDVMKPLHKHGDDIDNLKDSLESTDGNVAALDRKVTDVKDGVTRGDTALASVFGMPGSSNVGFFNNATTWNTPGIDLQLLRHTNAVMGLTVANQLAVTDGKFSVCTRPGGVCSEFNDASGNIHLRTMSSNFVGVDSRAVFGGGSGFTFTNNSLASVDISGDTLGNDFYGTSFSTANNGSMGTFWTAQDGTVAVGASGGKPVTLVSRGAAAISTCGVSSNGMYVKNTPVSGTQGTTTVLQIDQNNNVLINAANIKLQATGTIGVNKAPIMIDASGNAVKDSSGSKTSTVSFVYV